MMREEIFREALIAMIALGKAYPDRPLIGSAIEQLNYLIDIETGAETDKSKLPRINIGLIAVREIEALDETTADKLHAAAFEARNMA